MVINRPSISKEEFVPKKYGLRPRRLCKPFAVADFETILDKEKNHRVVTAGFRYYPSGSQGKPKTFTFSLDPENLTEENLAVKSTAFIKNFIKILQEFLAKKAHRIKSDVNLMTYFHNFGAFDGIFILEALHKNAEFGEFTPLFRNGRIYQIGMKDITFRDSYLLLPAGLNELGKAFLNETKEEFPLNELNLKNYKEKRRALEEYMKKDLKLLGDVLKNFQEEIKTDFNLDISMSLSLSGLSYQIYRTHFMPRNTIHISTEDKNLNDFLQNAYLGGFTELYQPKPEGPVYAYDVNSAYPYVMADNPMPVGAPTLVENFTEFNFSKFFGFIEATVYIHSDSYIPPLVIRHPTEGSLISPVGIFRGYFFSEELRLAMEDKANQILYFHKGYQYKKRKIFEDFVRGLYRRRRQAELQSEKGRAFIYKFILNSLYGRFAMKELETVTRILSNDELAILRHFQGISNPKPITGTNSTLVTLHPPFSEPSLNEEVSEEFLKGWSASKKIFEKSHVPSKAFFIATQISAATAAYARIHIFRIKQQLRAEGYKIYYSDTDSVYINKPLPRTDPLRSFDTLGKLKPEGSYEKAIFLAPKIYILANGEEESIAWRGLPASLRKTLSFNDFLKAWETGEKFTGNYEQYFKRKWNSLTVSQETFPYTANFSYNKREKVYEKNKAGKEIWVDTKPFIWSDYRGEENLEILEELHFQTQELLKKKDWESKTLSSSLFLPLTRFELFLKAFNFGSKKCAFNGLYYHLQALLQNAEGNNQYLGSSFQFRDEFSSKKILMQVGGRLNTYKIPSRETTNDRDFKPIWDSIRLDFFFYKLEEKEKILRYAHSLQEILNDFDLNESERTSSLRKRLGRRNPFLAKVYDFLREKITETTFFKKVSSYFPALGRYFIGSATRLQRHIHSLLYIAGERERKNPF